MLCGCVLGAWLQISRKDRSSAIMSLQLAADSVRPGESVTISPEGTRSPSGLLLPFKKGTPTTDYSFSILDPLSLEWRGQCDVCHVM